MINKYFNLKYQLLIINLLIDHFLIFQCDDYIIKVEYLHFTYKGIAWIWGHVAFFVLEFYLFIVLLRCDCGKIFNPFGLISFFCETIIIPPQNEVKIR